MNDTDSPDVLSAACVASYAHVDALVSKADGRAGSYPWWHGWALREAFEAGARWQRTQTAPESEWARMEPARLIALLRKETDFDPDMIERMLQFAIDAAQQAEQL